jgi:PIN like domain
VKILFDHGTPRSVAQSLTGHEVTRAAQMGWHELANGELIEKAEAAGFELLLSTDKNIRYQQNLKDRQIAIVVLTDQQWPNVRLHLEKIAVAVDAATAGSYAEVEIPLPPKKPFPRQ